MITLIKFLFSKVPAHWWRNGARGILISACAFYLLDLTGGGIIDRYLSIFIHSLFWKFAFFNVVVYGIFYCVVDVLLRLLAFKVIKGKIVAGIVTESKQSRIGFLRGLNEIKSSVMGFVMGYPVELGYVSTSDLREIGTSEPLAAIPIEEKEKAINAIITAINKWACVLIHLVFALFFVWHFDRILLISIFVLGFVLTAFFYFGVIFAIHNIELIVATVQKEFRRLK